MASRRLSPTAAKPILGTARRSAWRVAVDLYASNGTFRGVVDFAVIGTILLVFLHAQRLSGVMDSQRNSWTGMLSKVATGAKPTWSTAGLSGKLQDVKSYAPRIADADLTDTYFAAAPEPTRALLGDVWREYRKRDYSRALAILAEADATDRRVLLLQGLVTIALPGSPNLNAGMALLERAISLGEPKAMVIAGIVRTGGLPGLTRDIDAGRRLLERASEAGDAAAPRILGEGLITGWAGAIDLAAAVRYFRLASERGDHKGSFRLAEMHFGGVGMPRNYEEADRLLLRAAEGGYVEAQAFLGMLRLLPYYAGVTDHPDDGLRWLELATRRREPHAMHELGLFYIERGQRTGRQDFPRGAELLRRCAELTGYAGCMLDYGTALDFAIGTPHDSVLAYAMYTAGVRTTPSERASKRMEELAKTMSAAELSRAQTMAGHLMMARPSNP